MTAPDGTSDAAGEVDGRFTERLRERSDWAAAVEHRFVDELGTGTIDDAVFGRYLIQDYAFVDTLVGTIGHAVGQAPTMAAKRRLVAFLDVLTDDENDYFERAFDALGVPASDRTDPELAPATRAFIDLLERAARQGGYAETLAVVVPAEWVYLDWATAAGAPTPFYLREWIELHRTDGFAATVGWLREQLDDHGPTLSARRRRRVARLFERTVSLEAAFFETAYGTDTGGRW